MEVQINNCPVDFKLEGEKTISEVINTIVDWSKERNLIFTEAEINKKCYPIEELPDISLGDIEKINCFVLSKSDVVISSIEGGIEYCDKIQNFFIETITSEKIEASEIENISDGIEWIVEVTGKISDLLGFNISELKYKDNPVNFYVDKLLDFRKNIINKNPDYKLIEHINKEKDIFSMISGILKMFLMTENMKALVIQSIDSPDMLIKSLMQIKEEIPEQIKNLEEIAVSYQTGKDDIASQKLEFFIDFIFNYGRTCYQVAPVFEIDLDKIIIDDISLAEKNRKIQNLLDDIIEVMENNDIVSLSDILEYEMKSSLETLGNYIDLLIGLLKKADDK